MKVSWEKCAWWGVLCVLVGLLSAIYKQSLARSERIKQQDEQISSLRQELRSQEGRYLELQRSIRSYRQVSAGTSNSGTTGVETPAEPGNDTNDAGSPSDDDEDPEQSSHWLLDVEDPNVHSLVAELSAYADQLSESEWMVVRSAKEMIHEKLLEHVSDEEKEAIMELSEGPYFSVWLDELVELTALDSLRANE